MYPWERLWFYDSDDFKNVDMVNDLSELCLLSTNCVSSKIVVFEYSLAHDKFD